LAATDASDALFRLLSSSVMKPEEVVIVAGPHTDCMDVLLACAQRTAYCRRMLSLTGIDKADLPKWVCSAERDCYRRPVKQ